MQQGYVECQTSRCVRQYYGLDLECKTESIVNRVAYRSQFNIRSEGTDPCKLIVKPFPQEMVLMSRYFRKFIKYSLGLQDVNTTAEYHSLPNFKKESSMGWHTDSKYSISAKYCQKNNGQLYNTPVVIFTIGMDRLLFWRRRHILLKSNGRKTWCVEKDSIEKMLLSEGSVCIINPYDEAPHIDTDMKKTVHFQHGNTKVKDDTISVAFVFRVSPHTCLCNKHNNTVILPEDIMKDVRMKETTSGITKADRQMEYDKVNVEQYHEELLKHFKIIF